MEKNILNPKRLKASFRDAGRGVRHVFVQEQNFRLQLLISLTVLFLAWYFPLSKGELIVVLLLIFLVLILELMNTAFERLSDVLKPRLFHQIGVVKDIMAAMVLLSSLGAAIIGLIIFYPHLIAWFE